MAPLQNPKYGTAEWALLNPIYFTPEEMQKPLPELIECVRRELATIRGKLGDLKRVGWSDRFDAPEGGLTLVIANLYYVMQEIEKAQRAAAMREES